MIHIRAILFSLAVLLAACASNAQGNLLPLPEDKPIKGASFPSISPDGRTICFSYLGDLWTVDSGGGTATRLTVHEAHDGYSRWSPDGKWIAFASNRYNAAAPSTLNYDVFVIPASGGEARRISSHSANDYPGDWSPDGTKVLFYSMRGVETWQIYSIDVGSRVARTLTEDDGFLRYPAYSPDGKTIAYVRSGGTGIWWRPKYHGSANMDVYTKSLASGKITRITTYDGMDLWPQFSRDGARIYYVSDQLTPGTPNIVWAPAVGGHPILVTNHKGGTVRFHNISRNGELLTYEYEGDIWTVSASGGKPRQLRIIAPSDEKRNSVERITFTNGATELDVNQDGKTIALVVRGELWTIPSDRGGDAKRLTNNPAHDYQISWSPDKKTLAFASDRNGQFDIFTLDTESGSLKTISAEPVDESLPSFSPDGKLIAFLRSGTSGGLYVTNADGTGGIRRLAESQGNNQRLDGISSYAWSYDSKWMAFSRMDPTRSVDIWVVPVAGGNPVNVTYYPGLNYNPDFTRDGKYITFLSDRDHPGSTDLYVIPLQKEREEAGTSAPPIPAARPPIEVKIDFDDIENRARRVTTQGSGPYAVTPDSQAVVFASAGPDYWSVPIKGGNMQRLTTSGDAGDSPHFTEDGSRFFYVGAGGTIKSVPRGGGLSSQVPFSARMDLDRRLEVQQAFNEFWRRINVNFYDPTMHGVDWRAVRTRYEPLLAGVGTKEDFWYLLSEMVGELNSSHSEISPAPGTPGFNTAELGITFDESYAGPGLKVTGFMPKGPNDDLGPKIKPGEYVLQIDGTDVRWNEDMFDTLLDKAGKTIEMLVNDKALKEGARTVKIKPITRLQWAELAYERKVHEARARVEKLSGGRLAYIRIQAMTQPSLRKLERELWGKAREKDGLVLDVRGNTGGNTHDDILNQLSRIPYAFVQPRDAPRSTQPFRHWDKPIVLLIDENSVSDAEIFPNGFRALKLGKIVGVASPGYVIGTYEGTLQDGTGYRMPTQGYFTLDGKDLENNGVKPDILVAPTVEDMTAHRDRQLEVAVETLLKEIPKKSASARSGGVK